MVNFIYQLDLAMGSPDIWFNIRLDWSAEVFLDQIDIWICRLSKQIILPDVDGAPPIYWRSK